MEKKLIIPTEIKICATCSYWDGERQVDDEYKLVVVAEDCKGECLVCEEPIGGLNDVTHTDNCAWEPLDVDETAEADASGSVSNTSLKG